MGRWTMLSPATSATAVGRGRELAALRQAMAASLDGTPHGVVIAGEAGIGKSRLLDDFAAGLDDVAVARGQCVALGSLPAPFAPLRGVLRDLVATFGADALLAADGPIGRLLPAVLPELADGGAPEISQEQLHDAVSLLLEHLSATAPLAVVVEDVHWADLPTLDLLRNLLHTLRRGRVLVVLSYRTDDVDRDGPLPAFLVEVDRARRVARIELSRLAPAEIAEQARLIRGDDLDPEALAALVERSDGIPFYVEELLGLGPGRGPPMPATLRGVVLARYARLRPPTQGLLRTLAAGGMRVEHDLLEQVHRGDPEQLDAAMREAIAAHVLTADGTAYRFRHALTHEAVHDELLPGERRRIHARYAEALEHAGGAGRAAEIAHHWLEAHEPRRALASLIAASREAQAAGAPMSAATLGERALALWPAVPDAAERAGCARWQLFLAVGSAYDEAGDARAVTMLDEALAEVPADDRHGRALLLHESMIVRHSSGLPGGLDLCREALALLPEDDDEEGRAIRVRVLCGLGITEALHREPGARATLERAAADARALLASTRDPAIAARARFELARALTNLSSVRALTGEVDESLAGMAEALALSGADPSARLRHDEQLAMLLHQLGRYDQAHDLAIGGHEFSRTVGMERGWGCAVALIGAGAALAVGALGEAEAILGRVRAARPEPAIEAFSAAVDVELRLLRDDLAGAAAAHRQAQDAIDDARANDADDDLAFARLGAELALADGDAAAAWAEVEHLWTGPPLRPGPAFALIATGGVVLDELRRTAAPPPGGTHEAAAARLRAALDAIAVWPIADDWRALLDAALAGDDAEAWHDAADRAALPVRQRAHALHRLADAHLAAGDRAAASAALGELAALAERCDLRRAARLADDLATRAGLERRQGASGPDAAPDPQHGLTRRELQVLELVAQGLTNRQIGERLFISGKTASVHVSAILRKLGARTRSEAAARAAQLLGAAPRAGASGSAAAASAARRR
ncbi:ATP-binding protein [Agrococcus sediminis]|uniref:ATP-binding protein n=1 Tax=Agrococcus sediminis TaxID=2599924 RepID=UPI00341BD3B0